MPSPIATAAAAHAERRARVVAFEEVRLGDLGIYDGALCWVERDPAEGNRPRLRTEPPHAHRVPDVAPESSLYGYGGGSWAASGTWLGYVRDDRALERWPPFPHAAPTDGVAATYGDLSLTPSGEVVAVRERPAGDRAAAHDVVSTADGATLTVLSEGHDLYSGPRVSPSGRWLVFLSSTRDGPPWLTSEAWLVDLLGGPGRERRLTEPRGLVREATWLADDTLLLVVEDGRDELWIVDPAEPATARRIYSTSAELGAVPWELGLRTVVETRRGELVLVAAVDGIGELRTVGRDGTARTLELPFTAYPRPRLCSTGDSVYVVAASAETFPALVEIDLREGRWRIVRTTFAPAPDEAPPPRVSAVVHDLPGGRSLQSVVSAPPEPADRVAVVVDVHSGPTDQAFLMQTPLAWLLTSLGLVVVQVNYRGSSGFGKAHRDMLAGLWGILDVEDVTTVLDRYADACLPVFLRGESAGGLTILRVAAARSVAGLASIHGVVDPASLRSTTHKFEAAYVEWLLGEDAASSDRTPDLAAVDCPAFVVTGSNDHVVPPDQARRLGEALSRSGKPVTLVELAGEGHGALAPAAIHRSLALEAEFYLGVLGSPPGR